MELKKSLSSLSFFKFCFIIRGQSTSGKMHIAKQLAGESGVILVPDRDSPSKQDGGEGSASE